MRTREHRDPKTEPRFPSGRGGGFFLQMGNRFGFEQCLTFRAGKISGEGRDKVGRFNVEGRYALDSGECNWTKQYIKQHSVAYRGFNEGQGIWGTWALEVDTSSL